MRPAREQPLAVVFLVAVAVALLAVGLWEHGITGRGVVNALGAAVAVTLGIRAGRRRRQVRERRQE
jgi:hypothetical protein